MFVGRIVDVTDHGTVVRMLLKDGKGRPYVVTFDHRMFWGWYENAVNYAGENNLTGMWVKVGGDRYDDETVSLPEIRKTDLT